MWAAKIKHFENADFICQRMMCLSWDSCLILLLVNCHMSGVICTVRIICFFGEKTLFITLSGFGGDVGLCPIILLVTRDEMAIQSSI